MKIPRVPTLATLATLMALAAGGVSVAQAQVRPEVGKPLQQASDYLKAGKAKEALSKVREAEAVGGKSAAEQATIDRMKAAAAQRAGDYGAAIQALESLYGRAGGAEQGQLAEQLASAYAQQRNNAKASEWINKAIAAGNTGGSVRQMQAYLQGASGDYSAIAKDAAAAVSGAEQAGRRPDEGDLLRLADAQQRTGNNAGYVVTLEKLLSYYPKKDYWNAYLSRLPRKAGFADRFALDLLRLRLASGTLSKTEDYMEMAQLSLQAGLPTEARRIVDPGMKAGVMGTGAEQAGRRPDEGDLLRLADAQQRTGNNAGYVVTLEKLLSYYPKKDYWNAYLSRLPRKAGFADRFALDLLRLRLASGTLSKTEDYMEMAQLSLQAGLPTEARRIVDQGIKAGVMGTGAEAARHQRLRELAVKQEGEAKTNLATQAAEAETFKEGDGLVKVGYAYVSLGEVDKGIELIQKGIAKGNLKRAEDAKLRLGMAQLQSPKGKAAAVQTLRSIKGSDGVAEIARLWTILGAS